MGWRGFAFSRELRRNGRFALYAFTRAFGIEECSALVEYALGLLCEQFPLVTVPEELLPVYEGFFRRFGFRLSGSRVGLYRGGKREFFFNRTLA